MGQLTTHILDTAHGRPAAGVRVALFRIGDGAEKLVAEAVTNQDGRFDAPLLAGAAFTAGVYELRFHAGDYFRGLGLDDASPPFLDIVPIRFGVASAAEHYHVPLLISPYGYSTYRGS